MINYILIFININFGFFNTAVNNKTEIYYSLNNDTIASLIKRDSLEIEKEKALIKHYINSLPNKNDSLILLNDKEWIKLLTDHQKHITAFDKKYPFHYYKNLFDRDYLGDTSALPKIISILESENQSEIKKLISSYTFSEFKYKNPITNDAIIDYCKFYLSNKDIQYFASDVLKSSEKGIKILEEHLKSNKVINTFGIISKLIESNKSTFVIDFLEENFDNEEKTGINSSVAKNLVQKLSNFSHFLNTTKNYHLQERVALLAVRIYEKKILTNEDKDRIIYQLNTCLYEHCNNELLKLYDYGDERIIPSILRLKALGVTNQYLDIILWKLNHPVSNETLISILSSKTVQLQYSKDPTIDRSSFIKNKLYLLQADEDKKLLQSINNIYEYVFNGITYRKHLNESYFWNENLKDVVYYFKDEDRAYFINEIKRVIKKDYQNNGISYKEDLINDIINYYDLAQESTEDMLHYFKDINFISDKEYETAKSLITNKEKPSQIRGTFLQAIISTKRRFTFLEQDYPLLIKDLEHQLFNDFHFLFTYEKGKNSYGLETDIVQRVIILYNNKSYIMNPDEFYKDFDCEKDSCAREKLPLLINFVLSNNKISDQIYLVDDCQIWCSHFIGKVDPLQKLYKKYKLLF